MSRPGDRLAGATVEVLAAAFHGVARNHPFVDGNKRVALMAAYVFLELNGRELDAPEPEAVAMMVALSTGEASEETFAAWVRQHLRYNEGSEKRRRISGWEKK